MTAAPAPKRHAGKLNPVQSVFFADKKPVEELYDTEADPYEVKNLAADAQHAEKLAELRAELERWLKATNDIAGPTFGLLQEDLPDSPATFRTRFDQFLAEQENLIGAIRATSNYQVCDSAGCHVADEAGKILLDSIAVIDAVRRPLLPANVTE